MNQQRQHGITEGQHTGSADDETAASTERLARARAQLAGVYAAADAILDGIRLDDNERFLQQVRQSGGQ